MKHHTIILVPHARARFRKWRVTNRQLGIVVGVLVFFTALSIFTTFSFFTNTIDRDELERVRLENEELREVNRSFEGSIRTLQKQLEDFEGRTRQLAIVAGLDSVGGVEAGIGGDVSLDGTAPLDRRLDTLSRRAGELGDDLASVGTQLDERLRWIASTPAITPVRGILTSGYGWRRDPIHGQRSRHEGVDIATAPGRPVVSSADGIVLRAGRVAGLGNAVYVSHGYGLTTRYGHLSKISVVPGQRLRRGDTVGLVGSTGRATGYHLHYEVRRDGSAVDPIAYILDTPGS